MIDNERITDADLAARVAVHDEELAKLVKARLRRLRLRAVVAPLPLGDAALPLPPMAAAVTGGTRH